MGKIFITGDTHGDVRRLGDKIFPEGKLLTKEDIIIILGDFGLVWNNSNEEKYWLNWLESKPWTTMFIDGNHENFDMLYKYPIVEYKGNSLRRITESIYHIPRGTILNINDKSILCFGGAESVDKHLRVEGKTWWKEEMPTYREMDKLYDKDFYGVDYILTHTCPLSLFNELEIYNITGDTQLERFFDIVKDDTKGNWYFGHFHKDIYLGRFHAVYENIIELE